MPAWLRSLLARVVPDSDQDEVIGDLEEMHRRRLLRRGPWVASVWTSLDGLLTLARFVRPRTGARPAALISAVEVRLAL
ncbi:MAG: hypothetical protein OEO23_13680, partial [Gemmatimonadota bacterium]|nr:hypothetical protein [Gemmatimonadota bacterium]